MSGRKGRINDTKQIKIRKSLSILRERAELVRGRMPSCC